MCNSTPPVEEFFFFASFPLDFLIAICQYIDMFCINCFHDKTRVVNSRKHKKQPVVWRRRQCQRCKTVFTSYERPALDDSDLIIDSQGNKTPFNLGKLIISISRSFQHDKHMADTHSLPLALTVQEKLILHGKHISRDDISAITHDVLKRFDQLAGLQYAAQHDLLTLKPRPGRPATTYPPTPDDRPKSSTS